MFLASPTLVKTEPDPFPAILKLEDSLLFYAFPEIDMKRISSPNGQERVNMEIRRRRRAVGVFPRLYPASG
jgi:transposase-like protein